MSDDETKQPVLLTVRDFLSLAAIEGRLVTLSACETGIIGTTLPNEVVAFPSALLQAGYAGVAASLWSVSDFSTAMLMQYFYATWKTNERCSPAQALRTAQLWLRNTTNKEKLGYFEQYHHKDSDLLDKSEIGAVDSSLDALRQTPEHRTFAHPFWWAAFYLTGA